MYLFMIERKVVYILGKNKVKINKIDLYRVSDLVKNVTKLIIIECKLKRTKKLLVIPHAATRPKQFPDNAYMYIHLFASNAA